MKQNLDHKKYLKRAAQLSKSAREHGNTPFGAVLVDREGKIILEQENVEISENKCTGHAETALAEAASKKYSKQFLWDCTLYSIAEPCCMCSGAIYWANIGTVAYAISEEELLKLTGSNPQNPTFSVPCRKIFHGGQKDIKVIGPIAGFDQEIAKIHEGYWNKK